MKVEDSMAFLSTFSDPNHDQVSRYFTYCLNGAWKLIDNKDDQLTQQNGVALMKWDVPGCTEAFFEENFNLDHVCNAQLTQKPQGIPVVPGYIG